MSCWFFPIVFCLEQDLVSLLSQLHCERAPLLLPCHVVWREEEEESDERKSVHSVGGHFLK
jgi:hypothetical protein